MRKETLLWFLETPFLGQREAMFRRIRRLARHWAKGEAQRWDTTIEQFATSMFSEEKLRHVSKLSEREIRLHFGRGVVPETIISYMKDVITQYSLSSVKSEGLPGSRVWAPTLVATGVQSTRSQVWRFFVIAALLQIVSAGNPFGEAEQARVFMDAATIMNLVCRLGRSAHDAEEFLRSIDNESVRLRLAEADEFLCSNLPF